MLRNNIDNSDIAKNAAKCGVVWHKVFLYTGTYLLTYRHESTNHFVRVVSRPGFTDRLYRL